MRVLGLWVNLVDVVNERQGGWVVVFIILELVDE